MFIILILKSLNLFQPLLESHGTLIITPRILVDQWCEEISKHVCGDFKVLVYNGHVDLQPVYPKKLTEYDIVITNYNVLQSELHLCNNRQVVFYINFTCR